MKSQIEAIRERIIEGTMEEIEKGFDLLITLVKDKPNYPNQVTLLRGDFGRWKEKKLKGTGATDVEINSVVDRMLIVLTSLEKGEKHAAVSPAIRFLKGVKEIFVFIYEMISDLLEENLAGVLTVMALWFGGGYLLGMYLAGQDNNKMPDNEYYRRYVFAQMDSELKQELTVPDGLVYYYCGGEFAFQCNLENGNWAEVPGEQYGALPEGTLPVGVSTAVAGGAIPVGLSLFKNQILASWAGTKGNWRYVIYGLMFSSGVGYGYYKHRRKIPACSDLKIVERLRTPIFQKEIYQLISNRMNNAAGGQNLQGEPFPK